MSQFYFRECHKCQSRHVYCHCNCQYYKDEKKRFEADKERINKRRKTENALQGLEQRRDIRLSKPKRK